MQGSHHCHPSVSARGNRSGLPLITQLIKQHHIRRKAAHRLPYSLCFGIAQQHVTPGQTFCPGQLAPLIHHRHPMVLRRQSGG